MDLKKSLPQSFAKVEQFLQNATVRTDLDQQVILEEFFRSDRIVLVEQAAEFGSTGTLDASHVTETNTAENQWITRYMDRSLQKVVVPVVRGIAEQATDL